MGLVPYSPPYAGVKRRAFSPARYIDGCSILDGHAVKFNVAQIAVILSKDTPRQQGGG